jgi:hypothetical protein
MRVGMYSFDDASLDPKRKDCLRFILLCNFSLLERRRSTFLEKHSP